MRYFWAKVYLKCWRAPWELILTEPVPEVVEFRSADWAEKYFSAQSVRSSSRVTLSPSYTKQFASSIDLLAWPVQRTTYARWVDIFAWPVQRRFAYRAKFQKFFNYRGEIRSNLGYSTSFPASKSNSVEIAINPPRKLMEQYCFLAAMSRLAVSSASFEYFFFWNHPRQSSRCTGQATELAIAEENYFV